MTKMKTLTVSGQTYTVWDPEAVSFEQPQQLTPHQQALARRNLDVWSAGEMVQQLCPAFTESGMVVTCEPVEGYPLEVVSQILPTQSGSGEPSAENIRPIGGHSAVKLTRSSGKNLWQFEDCGGFWAANKDNNIMKIETGVRVQMKKNMNAYVSTIASWLPISVLDGKTITVSCNIGKSNDSLTPLLRVGYVSADFGKRNAVKDSYKPGSVTFTVDSKSDLAAGCTHIGLWLYVNAADSATSIGDYVDYTDFQIEIGNTATAYEPFKGDTFTVDLGQSVYGGSLDWNSGVLTVDRAIRTYTGTETDLNYNAKGYIGGEYTLASIISSIEKTTGNYGDVVCSHLRTDDSYSNDKEGVWCRTGKSGLVFNMDARENLANVTQQSVVDFFKQWFAEQYANGTPIQVVYKLGTPVTVQLTSQEVLALSGVNTLYSDTGHTEVTGKADLTAVVEKLTGAIVALGGNV